MKNPIYLLGDSILKGIRKDNETGRYVINRPKYLEELALANNLVITNQSKFGSTIEKGFRMIKRLLARQAGQMKYMVLEFGGNDCDYNWAEVAKAPEQNHLTNTPLAEFQARYEEVIDYVRSFDICPILMNLPPIDSHLFLANICKHYQVKEEDVLKYIKEPAEIFRHQERYSQKVEEIAQKKSCHFLDIRSKLMGSMKNEELIGVDGIHLTAEGYDLFNHYLISELKALI